MNYLPVNWQDGMKVNKDHFMGMEYSLRNEMRSHVSPLLSENCYGLLPEKIGKTSLDIFVKLDQSTELVVSLVHCQALTPSGARIDISHEMQQQEAVRISESTLRQMLDQSDKVYIKIELKPFERLPFGDPDPEENPPRLPFTQAKYQLHPTHDPAGYEFSIPIGCIRYQNGNLELDKTYIPPSLSMVSCIQLKNYFLSWSQLLSELYNNGLRTLAQIKENRGKQGISPPKEDLGIVFDPIEETVSSSNTPGNQMFIGNVVERIVVGMLQSLTSLIPRFQNLAEYAPPQFTLTLLQEMARNMYLAYSVLGISEKNRLLNYLSEALEVSDFKDTILQLIQVKYNHNDIRDSFHKGEKFMTMLKKLFDQREGFPSKDFTWTEVVGVFGDSRTKNQTQSIEIDTLDP